MTLLQDVQRKIRLANKAYWKDNKPIISDTEYDKLVEVLRRLSPNDPLLTEIGTEPLEEDNKVVHKKEMLSLAKFYNWSEIVSWAESVSRSPDEVFCVSPKYDGISIEMADCCISTRGKGKVGNNVTHLSPHIAVISSFEKDVEGKFFNDHINLYDYFQHDDDYYSHSFMRGELMVSHRRFESLQHNYPEIFGEYKTCRNLVAGFANSKLGSSMSNFLDNESRIIYIADLVSHRAYEIPVTLRDLKEGRNVVAEIMQFINAKEVGYPVDGVVIRLADDAYGESLGVTAHHPKSAMAYKFTSETVDVVLRDIEWNVGEEHVSPVAQFDPVQIDGVMVERATLHNPQWMIDHKVMVGSVLTIERRGGVIPKVIDVKNDPNVKFVSSVPTKCPTCGHPVKWHGKFILCTNPDCEGKCINKLIRGLNVFGIKGVGPALAEKACLLTGAKDIVAWVDWFGYLDDEHINRLLSLEAVVNDEKVRFTKNEVSILTRLANVRTNGVTAQQLLASVCIPKCSTEFVTTVDDDCGGIMQLLNVGAVDDMYKYIVENCKLDAVTNFMMWMEQYRERFWDYVQKFKVVSPVKKPKYDRSVCFTGSGPMPRHKLQEIALTKGYLSTDNSSNCTYLVAADPNGSSSKLKKARAKGVKIISYEEFLSL